MQRVGPPHAHPCGAARGSGPAQARLCIQNPASFFTGQAKAAPKTGIYATTLSTKGGFSMKIPPEKTKISTWI